MDSPKVLLLLVSALLTFDLSLSLPTANDPTVLNIEGLGYIKGKQIETVGYNGRQPKKYISFRNIYYARPPARFLVRILSP